MTERTEKQQELLQQFSENVADLQYFWRDEDNLCRWLKSRRWNTTKAEKMLRKSIDWRKENRVDVLSDEFEKPEVFAKFFPGGFSGEDRLGHPVYIDPIGRIDLRGLVYSCKKSDMIKSKVIDLERLFNHILPQQSKKHGKRITQCLHIMDFENFGKKDMWIPGAELYIDIIAALEANYPESLYKSYVINTPSFFNIAFSFIKPFLAEDTLKKVEFLGANWKERLLKDVSADQLPVHYGGTQRDPDGDEFCRSKICYGGTIPVNYYRRKEDLIPEGKQFKNIHIKRRSTFRLEFEVTQPDSALRWIFTSDQNDLAYGVYYKQKAEPMSTRDMVVVHSPSRVNCHLIPEDGFVVCYKPGVYVFELDNSYSLLRGKNMSYFVELIHYEDEPEDFSLQSTQMSPTRVEEEDMNTHL